MQINLPPGKRLTRPKQIVIDYLSSKRQHITAEQLYNSLKKDKHSIGLATVYRNLNELSEMGLVQRISYAGQPVFYEYCHEPHTHFYCEQCHSIHDIQVPDNSIDNLKYWQGHYIKEKKIELRGICERCLKEYFNN
ncbi:MAG: Fur family transcriptional regulator [Candidatus Komeilibacteria bacterium]